MHAGLHFTPVAMAVFTGRSGPFSIDRRRTYQPPGRAITPSCCITEERFATMLDDLKRADVGFEGLSGNRMLDQSITGFDPKRTSR
jgi:hypothetical protein